MHLLTAISRLSIGAATCASDGCPALRPQQRDDAVARHPIVTTSIGDTAGCAAAAAKLSFDEVGRRYRGAPPGRHADAVCRTR